MKYIGMPMAMWAVFTKSFEKQLTEVFGYDAKTAKAIRKTAKLKYKEIIAKLRKHAAGKTAEKAKSECAPERRRSNPRRRGAKPGNRSALRYGGRKRHHRRRARRQAAARRPYGPKELREPRSRRRRDRSRRRNNCMPRRANRQPRIASGQGARSPRRCGTTYPPDSPPGRRATGSMPIEFSPASGPNHKFLRCEDTLFYAEKHIGKPKRSQNDEF